MTKDINDIKRKLESLKPRLMENFKVKTVGVFGSYVRGEEKLGVKVDLVEKGTLKPRIGKRILKEVVTI